MWDYKLPEKKGKPHYLLIADHLEQDILFGELAAGERLLPHRELAARVGVNVSTITRAYAEIERRGLVTSMVGRGTFVRKSPPIAPESGAVREIIELGAPMLLAGEEPSIRPILQKLMQDDTLEALAKSLPPPGRHAYRETGASWLRRAGVDATADSVLVANGQQHALSSILRGLFSPGDRIVMAQFSTPGIAMLMLRAGIAMEGVMVDEDGIVPEKLDELCGSQTFRGLYFLENAQNPSARFTPRERLEALSEVIARHNLIVVEDGSLNVFRNRKDSTLSALLPGSSVYVASLGPAIFRALQVAFIHAPARLYKHIAQSIADSIQIVAPLTVAIACEAIRDGTLDNALKRKREELKRRTAMLRDILGDFTVTCSEGNIYAWLHLPDGWKARDFELQAERKGVRVCSVDQFTVGTFRPPDCIRLSLTGPPDILSFKQGLSILAGMLKKEDAIIAPLW